MAVLVALHVLAAVVWVGGMFFVMLALRPAVESLEPPVRLPLVRACLAGFFRWVWAAIALLLATGYWMLLGPLGGLAGAGAYLHLMQAIGWVMVLVYVFLYFVPWRRMRRALDAGDLAAAGHNLGLIRRLVWINLALGLTNVAVGASGRYWA